MNPKLNLRDSTAKPSPEDTTEQRVVEGQKAVKVAGEILRDLAATTHTVLIEHATSLTIATEDE